MKVFLLDNYDSFTFNLVQLIEELGVEVVIKKNDKVNIDEIAQYSHLLLSPGAGLPSEAGILLEVIKNFSSTHSILGICLGHQAIGEVFGANLINLPSVFHGQRETCNIIENDMIFKDIPTNFNVGLYHSWAVENWNDSKIPLKVLAKSEKNIVMALRHQIYKVWGVQFHPESIISEYGSKIIENWLKI